MYDSTAGTDILADTFRIELSVNWSDKNPKGWSYNDKDAGESGVHKAQLRTGDAGKAKAQVAVKGAFMRLSGAFDNSVFFDQGPRVTVQLFNDTTPTCWTSEFTSATKNDVGQFKAKTP